MIHVGQLGDNDEIIDASWYNSLNFVGQLVDNEGIGSIMWYIVGQVVDNETIDSCHAFFITYNRVQCVCVTTG